MDEMLKWYMQIGDSLEIRQSALTALQLVEHWRSRSRRTAVQLTLFDTLEGEE